MGYVHDTAFSQFVPPNACAISAGTWTLGDASNVVRTVRTAADALFTVYVPVLTPQNARALKGARLKSVDVFYKVATADADDFATAELEKMALKVTGSAISGAAVSVALDSGHDTAAKRKAQGDHMLTLTLTVPSWVDEDDVYWLKLVVDAAATTVFTFFGVRVNYDLRV
jgi:hypothetical protein